ncbi:MAG: glycosyltransferase [Planctomyces sp.]|nr:glycosyltransferase [Planctomyces sp.]
MTDTLAAADSSVPRPSTDGREAVRITFLIPTLDRAGAEKQLVLLACGLPRDRFQVDVIGLTRGGPLEADLLRAGIPVTVLKKRGKVDVRAFQALRERLRNDPPDILHTWLFAGNSYGRLAASGNRRFRIVVSERCVDSWKSGWQLWLDRRLISRTDRLLANSESVAEFYRSHGYPASKVTVIPNGVTPPPPPAMSRAEFLESLDLPAETKLVGYIGRLAKQKRVQDLLWGLQVLRQADPRCRLAVVGDGPEREHLEQYARDVECSAFVRFLGHREDAARLLHHFDAFWLASDFEGLSNSLMEAMAIGLPSIASDIPPNRELIQHGEHGYLANLGDGVAFAQYTVKLLGDDALRTRLGEAARRRMQTEFSVEAMIAAHAALYETLTPR